MPDASRDHRPALHNTLFVVLLALSITLFGCTNSEDESSSQKPSETMTATLAAFQLYVSALVVAADNSRDIDPQIDCFDAADLKATVMKRSKGPEVVDALVGGSTEFGTLAITPVVLQALQGSDLAIFATIMTTDHDIKVVGRRSAGVTSGAALKGKKVGYVGGTIGEIFLDRYLAKHGIRKQDVFLTSGGPAQLRDLLLNGSVDAIIIWEPIIQDILRDPAIDKNDVYLDVDRDLYVIRMNLVARPQTLRENPEKAKRLLHAMLCGEKLLQQNPEAVRTELERWLDRQPGTLENVFDPPTFHIQLDVPQLLAALEAEAEWAQRSVFSGKATIPNSFTTNVDATILEAVAPERVKK